jgi:hypothetical protein
LNNKITKYTRNPDFIFRKIVEEMILVPINQDIVNLDSIFSLNEVGAFIWEQLAEPVTREELYAAVQEEYEVSKDVVSADVDQFLAEVEAYGGLHEV